MSTQEAIHEDALLHFVKNQLSIILGFADLVLEELDERDRRHGDLTEIRRAAQAMIERMPELSRRLEGAKR